MAQGRSARLNERELRFVREYVTSGNAYQAALAAGYSKKAAARQSYELVNRPVVVAQINRLYDAMRGKNEMTLFRLLDWSISSALTDLSTIFKPGTFEVLPLNEWRNPDLRKLVEKVTVKTKTIKHRKTGTTESTTTIQVAFASRNAMLDRAARMMGFRKPVQGKIDEKYIQTQWDALKGREEAARAAQTTRQDQTRGAEFGLKADGASLGPPTSTSSREFLGLQTATASGSGGVTRMTRYTNPGLRSRGFGGF